MSSAGSLFFFDFKDSFLLGLQQPDSSGVGVSKSLVKGLGSLEGSVQHCVNLWRLQSLKWNQVNGESMFTFNILRNGMLRHFCRNCNDLCCLSVLYVAGLQCIRNRYKEKKNVQWHIFCQRVGLMMGRLLVGATDFWPTMSGISSDGKEVKDTFGCLAEITLNKMLNILLMLEFLGVLHLSNLIQLYILSTPNGGVSLTYILQSFWNENEARNANMWLAETIHYNRGAGSFTCTASLVSKNIITN